MKTIEEAAKEYSEKVNGSFFNYLYPNCDETLGKISINDFSAGVEFSERFIPVNEELPEDTQPVIVMNKDGVWDKGYRIANKWVLPNKNLLKASEIITWRPINHKKQ